MEPQPLSTTGLTAEAGYVLPLIPLDQAESERIALTYLQEDPAREVVSNIVATTGYFAYLINGKRWRDRQRILSMIDLEAVLVHYGLEIDYNKTSPGGSWRVYRWANRQIKQRIGVVQPVSSPYKLFGFLNKIAFDDESADSGFPTKGNVLSFIHLMEKDTKKVFPKVDELASSPAFLALIREVDTLTPSQQQTENAQGYSTYGQRVREEELRTVYELDTIIDSKYLEGRGIPRSTQERASFWGKILFARRKTVDPTTQKERISYYTAFPMTGHEGSILSLNFRNRYANLFPKGIRGNSVWRSNDRGRLLRDLVFPNITLPARTEFYYSITEQFVYLATPKFRVTLKRALWDKLMADKALFEPIVAKEIVLGEAPIDLLSHSILFPRTHHTLYLGTCGRVSRLATEHIRSILKAHPGAILSLANDNDEDGLRFGINYLNFIPGHDQHDDQFTVKVRARYILPEELLDAAPDEAQPDPPRGSTQLELEFRQPLKGTLKTLDRDFLLSLLDRLSAHSAYFDEQKDVYFMEEPYLEEQIAGSSVLTLAKLTLPDRREYLRELFFSLLSEINRRQCKVLVAAQPYKGHYKDFNEWLQAEQNAKTEQTAQPQSYE